MLFLPSFMIVLWATSTHALIDKCDAQCFFDGKFYNVNSVLNIENGCFMFSCVRKGMCANWHASPGISSLCSMCQLNDDPHIKSFDGSYYDYHGIGKFSLTQEFTFDEQESHNPEFAVYSWFDKCYGARPVPTCVKSIELQDTRQTKVFIDFSKLPGTPFTINGAPQCAGTTDVVCDSFTGTQHSVIFWKYGNCYRFQGKNLAVEACPGIARIWVHQNHKRGVSGLCGFFTGKKSNDFFTRQLKIVPQGQSNVFAETWRTRDQQIGRRRRSAPVVDLTNCQDLNENLKLCNELLTNNVTLDGMTLTGEELTNNIQNCASDMCADPENPHRWLGFYHEIGTQNLDIASNTRNIVDPPIPEIDFVNIPISFFDSLRNMLKNSLYSLT